MSDDDHSPEFRQRVLDALNGERTLEDVAREFRIPADLLFSWVKDAAANGTLHPHAAISTAGAPHGVDPSARPQGSRPEVDSGLQPAKPGLRQLLLIALFAVAFAALIPSLWGMNGFHDSRAYWRASWRGWVAFAVVIGIVLCPLFLRERSSRSGTSVRVPPIAALAACALSSVALGGLYAFLAPHVMHRIERTPVQIETTVVKRTRLDGRGGPCRSLDTAISPQYVTVLLCVDERTYDKAQPGQRLRINGFQSWYGLEVKSYTILDK